MNDYRCVCIEGYIGINCEINRNDCAAVTCLNGATCAVNLQSLPTMIYLVFQLTFPFYILSLSTHSPPGSFEWLQLFVSNRLLRAPLRDEH